MKRKILALSVAGVLICGSLIGCGKAEEETTTEEITTEATTTEEVTEEEVVLKTIGEEDEDSYQVVLTNSTGQDIVSVTVYDTESDSYSEELLAEDDPFLKDEQRIVYYPNLEELTENNSEDAEDTDTEETVTDESDDEKLVTIRYDVKFVLADDTEYVVHAFPFGVVDEISLFVEDEIAYVENEELSSKEAELAILEQEKEEEAAANQTSNQSNNRQSSQPATQPAAEPTPAPAPEPAPAPAPVDQDSENCIGDEGLTY